MKTLFIIFSMTFVILFAGAIVAGDANTKSVVISIHDRASNM